ncbi:hypothetical protein KKE60_08890 [Patescibacteria group bacterium]|nr:hypothetical protein [Patescibacteria group bacterium]
MKDINRKENFKTKEELQKYVEDKLDNGWIVAEFKSEEFFNVLVENFYGNNGKHSDEMERINDRWTSPKTVWGEGKDKKELNFPTVHMEALILIKKGETLDMILGKGEGKNNNQKLIHVLFHEGGVGEGAEVKDGDITAHRDFSKYIVDKSFAFK